VIWICIHTKLQCWLNLQLKTNIKEWHLLNGFRIMKYHTTMCGFLMWHTSTCDLWEGASCTENYGVNYHLKSWTARANILWRDSEQWVLLKHFAQNFCASPSCYRFSVINSIVHAGSSQATHNECCFALSAWYFQFACHLKLISWWFHVWTELSPE
jgi:hypothetical protein